MDLRTMYKALRSKNDVDKLYEIRKELPRGLDSMEEFVDMVTQVLEEYSTKKKINQIIAKTRMNTRTHTQKKNFFNSIKQKWVETNHLDSSKE